MRLRSTDFGGKFWPTFFWFRNWLIGSHLLLVMMAYRISVENVIVRHKKKSGLADIILFSHISRKK